MNEPLRWQVGDVRGDLHSHTTLSDGRNSLEEMAEASNLDPAEVHKLQMSDSETVSLAVPVGEGREQQLIRVTRRGRQLVEDRLGACVFVPLIGSHGWGDARPARGVGGARAGSVRLHHRLHQGVDRPRPRRHQGDGLGPRLRAQGSREPERACANRRRQSRPDRWRGPRSGSVSRKASRPSGTRSAPAEAQRLAARDRQPVDPGLARERRAAQGAGIHPRQHRFVGRRSGVRYLERLERIGSHCRRRRPDAPLGALVNLVGGFAQGAAPPAPASAWSAAVAVMTVSPPPRRRPARRGRLA